MSRTPTRRTLLTALGTTAATTLAGCSNNASGQDGSNENQSTTNQTNDVFANVESVPGDRNAKLRVSVSDSSDVGAIALHDSNDMQKQREPLGAGSTVELSLREKLDSGTYDLVAVTDDGKEVARQSVDLSRSVTIQDVRIYSKNENPARAFEIDLKNTGDFAIYPESFGAYGDVPKSSDPEDEDNYTVASKDGILVDFSIMPGKTATLQMNDLALRVDHRREAKKLCSGETHSATVRLQTKNGLKKESTVTYSLSGSAETAPFQGEGCSTWAVESWET